MLIYDSSLTVPAGQTLFGPDSLFSSMTVTDLAGSNGRIKLTSGSSTNPGYIEFFTPDLTRRGYIGWNSGSNLVFQAENGWGLLFASRPIDGSSQKFVSTAENYLTNAVPRYESAYVIGRSSMFDNGSSAGAGGINTSSMFSSIKTWSSVTNDERYAVFADSTFASTSTGLLQGVRSNNRSTITSGTQAWVVGFQSYSIFENVGGTVTTAAGLRSGFQLSVGATVSEFRHVDCSDGSNYTGVATQHCFYGNPVSGTSLCTVLASPSNSNGSIRWGLYFSGSVPHYMLGDVRIGSSSAVDAAKLSVTGAISATSTIRTNGAKFVSSDSQPGIILHNSATPANSRWLDVNGSTFRLLSFDGNLSSPGSFVTLFNINSAGLADALGGFYGPSYATYANDGNGYSFWGTGFTYRIWMSSFGNGTYGGNVDGDASDYNMYFGMLSGSNRGFVFRDNVGSFIQLNRTAARIGTNLYARSVGSRTNTDHSSGLTPYGYRKFRIGGGSEQGWFRVARFQLSHLEFSGLEFEGTYYNHRINCYAAEPRVSKFHGGMRAFRNFTATVTGDGSGATVRLTANQAGVITSCVVLTSGSGYSTASISITNTYGSGATFSVSIMSGGISSVTVTSGGSGYAWSDSAFLNLPAFSHTNDAHANNLALSQTTSPCLRLVRIAERDWELQASCGVYHWAEIEWRISSDFAARTTVTYYDTSLSYTALHGGASGTVSINSGSGVVTGSGTLFTSQYQVGEIIWFNGVTPGRVITSISSDTSMTVTPALDTTATGVSIKLATPDSIGSVSVEYDEDFITGSATTFLTQFVPGDKIRVQGDPGIFTVLTVTSNTAMTVTPNFTRTTASNLVLFRYAEASIVNSSSSTGRGPGYGSPRMQASQGYFGLANAHSGAEAALVSDGPLKIIETGVNPTAGSLTSGSNAKDAVACYMKNDKLVFAYNNSGTVTYLSIPLDGSTTTWTHNTTAP